MEKKLILKAENSIKNISWKEMYSVMKAKLSEHYNSQINDAHLHQLNEEVPRNRIFEILNNQINQIDLMKNQDKKSSRIEEVFNWYLKKEKLIQDLKTIDKRTAQTLEEVIKIQNEKSNTYRADNYPTEFEFENRTEVADLLPPKNRLKQFQRKRIEIKEKEDTNQNKNKQNVNNETDRQRAVSAISNVSKDFKSTLYSTNYQTGFNFTKGNFQQIEHKDCAREIRTNFGYLNPDYNARNLEIEKQKVINKNREIAEARNKREMLDFVDEWSRQRSRMIEEVERKRELMKLLENYQSANILPHDTRINNKSQNLDSENPKSNRNLENISPKADINPDNSLIQQENNLDEGDNVITTKIRNVEDNLIIKSKPPIIINHSTNMKVIGQKNSQIDFYTENNDKLTMDSKSVSFRKNPILQVRENFSTTNCLKSISNYHDGYTYHHIPISVYEPLHSDYGYLNYFDQNKGANNSQRPSTTAFNSKRRKEFNPLEERLNLAFKNNEDMRILKEELARDNIQISKDVMRNAFLLPLDKKIQKLILPKGDLNLPANPFPVTAKKKGNKK